MLDLLLGDTLTGDIFSQVLIVPALTALFTAVVMRAIQPADKPLPWPKTWRFTLGFFGVLVVFSALRLYVRT